MRGIKKSFLHETIRTTAKHKAQRTVREAIALFLFLGLLPQAAQTQAIPDGDTIQVNSFTSGDQILPRVAHLADRSQVIVWTSEGSPGDDSDNDSVQARRFDSLGRPIGDRFQVNTLTTGFQGGGGVATTRDGFVVVYSVVANLSRVGRQKVSASNYRLLRSPSFEQWLEVSLAGPSGEGWIGDEARRFKLTVPIAPRSFWPMASLA